MCIWVKEFKNNIMCTAYYKWGHRAHEKNLHHIIVNKVSKNTVNSPTYPPNALHNA